jgi:hypothetical protein
MAHALYLHILKQYLPINLGYWYDVSWVFITMSKGLTGYRLWHLTVRRKPEIAVRDVHSFRYVWKHEFILNYCKRWRRTLFYPDKIRTIQLLYNIFVDKVLECSLFSHSITTKAWNMYVLYALKGSSIVRFKREYGDVVRVIIYLNLFTN